MKPKKLAYFKFFHNDWQNSLAVRSMTASERGVYLSALVVQATFGFVPSDISRMARLMDLDQKEVRKAWPVVAKQFTNIESDGNGGYINERLSQIIGAIENESNGKSAGAQKANAKRWNSDSDRVSDTDSVSDSDSDSLSDTISDQNPTHSLTLRAYDSDSVSSSGDKFVLPKPANDHLGEGCPTFCDFYALWPRRVGRKEAYKAYHRHVPSSLKHNTLMRGSAKALSAGGILHGRPLDKMPYPATWINGSDWYDQSGDLLGQQPESPFTPEQLKEESFNPGDGWEKKYVTTTRTLPGGGEEKKQIFQGWVRK